MRLNLDLERLILMTAAKNPRTIVVVQAGAAIDMSAWIDAVQAVVFAWFGGEAGGPAVADILFGAANPCGKIAETFPLRQEDTPGFDTYPGDGNHAWYTEGTLVGYRHYDRGGREVLFPFGHGLSYTSFQYGNLRVTPEALNGAGNVTVTCTVTNTGDRPGSEIVQLYIGERTPRVVRAPKELKGFMKIELDPGTKAQVRFDLTPRDFAYWNVALAAWHVQSDTYSVLVGSSSRDIRLEATIPITARPDFS
jgi:beta-glucosidase